MERTKPIGLSVRILLKDDQGRLLLLKRSRKSKTNPGRWELPGGKVDPGESFSEGLLREVREETGLEISLQHGVGIAEQELLGLRVIHLILGGDTTDPIIHLSEEHQEYRWASREELESLQLADWLQSVLSLVRSQL
jgi:8-oxo-dGTP diphosphatase